MRRYDTLHCAFAKQGPKTDEFTPAPQIFPLLTRSPSIVVCVWCSGNRAERDAVADGLVLRIRKILALESTTASRRAQGSRIKYYHRTA